jgi:hypothetical protein
MGWGGKGRHFLEIFWNFMVMCYWNFWFILSFGTWSFWKSSVLLRKICGILGAYFYWIFLNYCHEIFIIKHNPVKKSNKVYKKKNEQKWIKNR